MRNERLGEDKDSPGIRSTRRDWSLFFFVPRLGKYPDLILIRPSKTAIQVLSETAGERSGLVRRAKKSDGPDSQIHKDSQEKKKWPAAKQRKETKKPKNRIKEGQGGKNVK